MEGKDGRITFLFRFVHCNYTQPSRCLCEHRISHGRLCTLHSTKYRQMHGSERIYFVKRHTHITIIASHHHCTNSLMRQGWQRWRRQSLTNRNDFRAKCIHNHFFPFIIRILWGVAVRIKQHQTPVPFRRECDCTATPTTTAACSTHLHNKRFWWFYDIFGLCHQNHTQLLSLPSIKLDTQLLLPPREHIHTHTVCAVCSWSSNSNIISGSYGVCCVVLCFAPGHVAKAAALEKQFNWHPIMKYDVVVCNTHISIRNVSINS